jgi:alpha-beta hydrolase superfamily lysophospholipase
MLKSVKHSRSSKENHNQVLLAGHSTGGLISTLYAAHYPDHRLIKALWANSPFYDFYKSVIEKKSVFLY